MKIALDAMGGDMAPQATLKGAIDALDKSKNKVLRLIEEKKKGASSILKIQKKNQKAHNL